jgi:hypothetical protein
MMGTTMAIDDGGQPGPAEPVPELEARPGARLGVRSPEIDAALAELGGTVTARPDGAEWTPPDRAAGRIRVHHARGPVRAADGALAAAAAELRRRATHVMIEACDRLSTREGEYAALGRITGRMGGAPFEVHVGVVLGDTSYAELHVLARRPDLIARFRRLARELVAGYELGLGDLRRRRFVYRPPPGWVGEAHHRATAWRAPDHPRRHGIITVADAMPERGGSIAEATADALAACSFPLDPGSRRRVKLEHAAGLRGDYCEALAAGGDRLFEVIALGDDRYIYRVAMEAAVDELAARRTILEALVESIEPLPSPRHRPGSTPSLSHWAE